MISIAVNVSTAGSTTLVPADAQGRRICVLGYGLSLSGTASVQFLDTNSNLLCGPLHSFDNGLSSTGTFAPRISTEQMWLFATAPGAGLVISVNSTGSVGGYLVYDLIP